MSHVGASVMKSFNRAGEEAADTGGHIHPTPVSVLQRSLSVGVQTKCSKVIQTVPNGSSIKQLT